MFVLKQHCCQQRRPCEDNRTIFLVILVGLLNKSHDFGLGSIQNHIPSSPTAIPIFFPISRFQQQPCALASAKNRLPWLTLQDHTFVYPQNRNRKVFAYRKVDQIQTEEDIRQKGKEGQNDNWSFRQLLFQSTALLVTDLFKSTGLESNCQ